MSFLICLLFSSTSQFPIAIVNAPSADGFLLTEPPITIQTKQSVIARTQQLQGQNVQHITQELYDEEVQKCHPKDTYFLFVSDSILR